MTESLIGRRVLVHREFLDDDNQPEAGIVLYVHTDGAVNVEGFSALGHPFTLYSCPLVDNNMPVPKGIDYATWPDRPENPA